MLSNLYYSVLGNLSLIKVLYVSEAIWRFSLEGLEGRDGECFLRRPYVNTVDSVLFIRAVYFFNRTNGS